MIAISESTRTHVRRNRNGKIKITTWNHARVVLVVTFMTLLTLTIIGFMTFDYKDIVFHEALLHTFANLQVMFFEPRLTHFTWGEAFFQVFITIGLAFLATVIGAILSVFLALFAARNLMKHYIANSVIAIAAVIRAVPTVLWVLIFAIAAGLGSEAAILGMLLHTVAFLVKAFAESFEELDQGVIEALEATGAKWWHIVSQAVIPSSMTSIVSWTFLRFETNFTVAVAMGAAAGAGGIGFELFMSSGFYFDLREVGLITYFILVIALVLEILSTQLKKKYLLPNT